MAPSESAFFSNIHAVIIDLIVLFSLIITSYKYLKNEFRSLQSDHDGGISGKSHCSRMDCPFKNKPGKVSVIHPKKSKPKNKSADAKKRTRGFSPVG